MKILVIGTIDNKGGAAQVSWELRKRLKEDGHTVSTYVRYKYSDESDVYVIPRKRYQDWLVKLFANDLRFAQTDYIFNTKEYKEADIVHFHNLHSNFFNLKNIVRISKEKPTAWTLHDMWAFTGFSYNSITLKSPNKKRFLRFLWDNTPFLLKTKQKIYNQSKLNIVTVSNWLKTEAEKGILKNQSISTIYNGIDIDTFTLGDKNTLRKILDLPLDKKIIACGIKGWIDSEKIIESYKDRKDVFFVAIAHNNIKTTNPNFKVLPRTEDRKALARYLGAIDIFLHPTPEDSFGLISAEAMACGVPVVTYNIDAIPEIVTHKQNGYVAEYQNTDDLRTGIEYLLNLTAEEYIATCNHSRERITDMFSNKKMYTEYLALYKKLLNN